MRGEGASAKSAGGSNGYVNADGHGDKKSAEGGGEETEAGTAEAAGSAEARKRFQSKSEGAKRARGEGGRRRSDDGDGAESPASRQLPDPKSAKGEGSCG